MSRSETGGCGSPSKRETVALCDTPLTTCRVGVGVTSAPMEGLTATESGQQLGDEPEGQRGQQPGDEPGTNLEINQSCNLGQIGTEFKAFSLVVVISPPQEDGSSCGMYVACCKWRMLNEKVKSAYAGPGLNMY